MGLASGYREGELIGYERAIHFIMTNLVQFNTASVIGSEEAVRQAQDQATTYYNGIQEGAIDLIAPVYYQNPEMFNARDDKKSLRIIAAGSNVPDAIDQAGVLLSRQYSAVVIGCVAAGTPIVDTQLYRWLGQNVVFTVPQQLPDGSFTETSLEYEAYARDTESGVRLINLKLKGDANPELDTQQHFAMAVMAFAKDINTNSMFRNRLGSLPGMKRMEINPSVAMIDFAGFGESFDTDALYADETMQGSPMTAQCLRRSDLRGVYVTRDADLSGENLTTIDQDIKAQEIFRLDEPEKYCEIQVTRGKLTDSRFIERAVEVKKTQGATAIILDVVDGIDLSTQESIIMLRTAITAIRAAGLKVIIKVYITKLPDRYEEIEKIFNMLFEAGFDGISLDATKISDVNKLVKILEILNRSSDMHSVEARNTIRLMDKEAADTLRELIGKALEGYNILFITDVDNDTGEVQVDDVRGFAVMRLGYERGRKLAAINVEVSAANISALLSIIATPSREVGAGDIRQAVASAVLNVEVVKHLYRILGNTKDEASGTQSSMGSCRLYQRCGGKSYLVRQYLEALGVSREVFEMNAVSDREGLGVLLTALFVANPQVFVSVETFIAFLVDARAALLGRLGVQRTVAAQRREAIEFINGLIERFEQEGMVTDEIDRIYALQIAIAAIDELLNKIMFSKIVEGVNHRAKVSVTALTRNVLAAA
jgi:hypothetical protein